MAADRNPLLLNNAERIKKTNSMKGRQNATPSLQATRSQFTNAKTQWMHGLKFVIWTGASAELNSKPKDY